MARLHFQIMITVPDAENEDEENELDVNIGKLTDQFAKASNSIPNVQNLTIEFDYQ